MIDLDPSSYGTYSRPRTKVAMIKRPETSKHAKPLLGHGTVGSTVLYFGIEVDKALELSVQIDLQRTCGP